MGCVVCFNCFTSQVTAVLHSDSLRQIPLWLLQVCIEQVVPSKILNTDCILCFNPSSSPITIFRPCITFFSPRPFLECFPTTTFSYFFNVSSRHAGFAMLANQSVTLILAIWGRTPLAIHFSREPEVLCTKKIDINESLLRDPSSVRFFCVNNCKPTTNVSTNMQFVRQAFHTACTKGSCETTQSVTRPLV